MGKKLLFVVNPFSGKAQVSNKLLQMVDQMVKSGYQVNVHPTQDKNDARMLIEKVAKKYDLVVVSGGDGTLDEAVSGMMRSQKIVPLGYIPAGSTNDFATSLNIPKDMLKACEAALHGKLFPCDVGKFGEKYFIYIAAFGIFTDVSYKTSQELKNILGHAAYILEGAKRIYDITSYHMQVEYNGKIIEDDFIYGMITNSTSVGGFKNMAGTNVLLDDGVFEVTLIRMPKNPAELNEILGSLTRLIDDTDLIYSFKTNHVKFTAQEKLPWTLDGEYGGSPKEVVIEIEHQALEIMVPEDH
ncbi:MAG: diacylglycerol/lipid kinase family protein [Lachnospiraceae bacterium]